VWSVGRGEGSGVRVCLVEVVWIVRWEEGESMQVKSLPQVICRMLGGVGIWIGEEWAGAFGPSWPFLESP